MTFPDTDSLDLYGGALKDYPIAATDATTDRPAASANQAYASVAAMTHTGYRAWARFTAAATTGAMILVAHDAAWGNAGGVAPALARSGTGVFTLTWSTTQTDELNVSHTVNFRAADGQARGATAYHVQAGPSSPNVVTVTIYSTAAVPYAVNDAVGVDIDVWVM